jgi:hypothetical protein
MRVFKSGIFILLESIMSNMLPRSLYRWSFVLLPILAVVPSACGTGGTGGGLGY